MLMVSGVVWDKTCRNDSSGGLALCGEAAGRAAWFDVSESPITSQSIEPHGSPAVDRFVRLPQALARGLRALTAQADGRPLPTFDRQVSYWLQITPFAAEVATRAVETDVAGPAIDIAAQAAMRQESLTIARYLADSDHAAEGERRAALLATRLTLSAWATTIAHEFSDAPPSSLQTLRSHIVELKRTRDLAAAEPIVGQFVEDAPIVRFHGQVSSVRALMTQLREAFTMDGDLGLLDAIGWAQLSTRLVDAIDQRLAVADRAVVAALATRDQAARTLHLERAVAAMELVATPKFQAAVARGEYAAMRGIAGYVPRGLAIGAAGGAVVGGVMAYAGGASLAQCVQAMAIEAARSIAPFREIGDVIRQGAAGATQLLRGPALAFAPAGGALMATGGTAPVTVRDLVRRLLTLSRRRVTGESIAALVVAAERQGEATLRRLGQYYGLLTREGKLASLGALIGTATHRLTWPGAVAAAFDAGNYEEGDHSRLGPVGLLGVTLFLRGSSAYLGQFPAWGAFLTPVIGETIDIYQQLRAGKHVSEINYDKAAWFGMFVTSYRLMGSSLIGNARHPGLLARVIPALRKRPRYLSMERFLDSHPRIAVFWRQLKLPDKLTIVGWREFLTQQAVLTTFMVGANEAFTVARRTDVENTAAFNFWKNGVTSLLRVYGSNMLGWGATPGVLFNYIMNGIESTLWTEAFNPHESTAPVRCLALDEPSEIAKMGKQWRFPVNGEPHPVCRPLVQGAQFSWFDRHPASFFLREMVGLDL